MRLPKLLVVSTLVALTMSVCACDHANILPTDPTPVAPRITAVSPASLVESDRPQTLTIHGEGFLPETSITVFPPSGQAMTMSGSLVQKLADGVEISVVLSTPGPYALRASNGASATAAPYALDVLARVKPWIGDVTPGTLASAPAAQMVTVTGTGFAPGLWVTLVNGQNATLIGDSAIANLTPTSFTLRFAFATPGTYAVNLVSSAGDPSNTVNVTVK